MLALSLVLLGCIPSGDVVVMTGTVYNVPNAAGSVVNGATVRTLNGDGQAVDEVQTDADGAFGVNVPEGEGFYVQTEGPEGEGYVPTAFSGDAGLNDFDAGIGFPWVASPEWFASLKEDWVDCPGAAEAGEPGSGIAIVGEIRMWINVTDIDLMPIQQGTVVRVTPAQGEEKEACYHDAAGLYDPAATGTGEDGYYAVFGVDAGGIAVSVEYDDTDLNRRVVVYRYLAVDASLVPIYPTFVYNE